MVDPVVAGSARLEMPDSDVRYVPGYWSPAEADALLDRCMELDWDQEHITLFGKTHPVPRLSSWHGDADARYRYANITMEPKPWVPVLQEIRSEVEREAGVSFNSVLANQYRNGRDRAAWHADDERELGPEPVIASVSLGATRRFRFRRKDASQRMAKDTFALDLAHGSLVIMAGATQANWQHEITKTARPVEPRVNLTFRRILQPSAQRSR